MTLDEALEYWAVHDYWGTQTEVLTDWHAVSNDEEGIIAYFAKREDAYRWRLSMVNRTLNQ